MAHTDDLSPAARALLDAARDTYDPTATDRARVHAAMMAKLPFLRELSAPCASDDDQSALGRPRP